MFPLREILKKQSTMVSQNQVREFGGNDVGRKLLILAENWIYKMNLKEIEFNLIQNICVKEVLLISC
jgi:hypothetical protein